MHLEYKCLKLPNPYCFFITRQQMFIIILFKWTIIVSVEVRIHTKTMLLYTYSILLFLYKTLTTKNTRFNEDLEI